MCLESALPAAFDSKIAFSVFIHLLYRFLKCWAEFAGYLQFATMAGVTIPSQAALVFLMLLVLGFNVSYSLHLQ